MGDDACYGGGVSFVPCKVLGLKSSIPHPKTGFDRT